MVGGQSKGTGFNGNEGAKRTHGIIKDRIKQEELLR
jgi:hypothetical protein